MDFKGFHVDLKGLAESFKGFAEAVLAVGVLIAALKAKSNAKEKANARKSDDEAPGTP